MLDRSDVHFGRGPFGKLHVRFYERGVDLAAIQEMLGHWHVGTTMRYANPRELHQTGAFALVA